MDLQAEQDKKASLLGRAKNVEKQLFRLKKIQKEEKEKSNALNELVSELEKIRETILENTEAKKALEKTVEESQLVQLFSEIKKELAREEKELRETNWKLAELSPILEEFRNQREYCFENSQSAIEFFSTALEHYSIEKVKFQIEIMGIVDPQGLEEKFNVVKKGTAYEASTNSIEPLIHYLKKNGIKKGFVFSSELFKANWKAEKNLLVKAEKNILKQLDSIAIQFSAKYS